MDDNQYIYRIDSGIYQGWRVRFGVREDGKPKIQRQISDRWHGKEKGKRVAIRYRNYLVRLLNYPTDGTDSNCKGAYISKDDSGKKVHYRWQASHKGRIKTVSISIHGYAGGYNKALAWRQERQGVRIEEKTPPEPTGELRDWLDAKGYRY